MIQLFYSFVVNYPEKNYLFEAHYFMIQKIEPLKKDLS